ncbi:hypothetical protein D3C81_1832210 [compost metagenome]
MVVRSKPNGLYGLLAEITRFFSAQSLYTPASVPRKNGSGAAWLADSRSLYMPRNQPLRLGVNSKRTCANTDLRSLGVSSRLFGAKL